MPVEPSDIGWTPWVRQTVQLSAAAILLAEPPEPRRRRNSIEPPPPPAFPFPRPGEFAVCLRCLPVVFHPLDFQQSIRSDPSSKGKSLVTAPGRGVSDRTAPALSRRRVSISRNAEECCVEWLSGRVVVEWVSALMRWQVEVQPIPCCCRRLALVTGLDRPECPPLDPPVACSPTLNQPSTTPGQGRGGPSGGVSCPHAQHGQ